MKKKSYICEPCMDWAGSLPPCCRLQLVGQDSSSAPQGTGYHTPLGFYLTGGPHHTHEDELEIDSHLNLDLQSPLTKEIRLVKFILKGI